MSRIPSFPTHIQIQTTAACGADCTICPHPLVSPKWSNTLMGDDLFDLLVGQLSGRSVEYLSPYLMADPMSDKKIFERIVKLREALPNTHFEVATTGKYLGPRLAEGILQAPINELRISSHGISAEEYAKTMPGVNYEKAMPNIHRFIKMWQKEKPYKLSIVCLWGVWPKERETEIEVYWQELGVELCKWRVVSRSQQIDLTIYGEGSPDPTSYKDGKKEPPYICRFHRDTEWMHILSDGRVTLCCMDYGQEKILGNVRETPLEQIWNSPGYQQVRAQIRGDLPMESDFLCNRCEWHISESISHQMSIGDSDLKV